MKPLWFFHDGTLVRIDEYVDAGEYWRVHMYTVFLGNVGTFIYVAKTRCTDEIPKEDVERWYFNKLNGALNRYREAVGVVSNG